MIDKSKWLMGGMNRLHPSTALRRADCLPSSLDSKAEERKYVSNVLKENGYKKNFST